MDLALDQRGLGNRWSLATGLAGWGLPPVTHVARQHHVLRSRRVGRIVTQAGKLEGVYGRWWAHGGNMLQVQWDLLVRSIPRDRCEIFFHVPLSAPSFLTLDYIHSGPGTSLSTFYAATLVLDEIAKLKQTSAIVCNVTNHRISDRLFQRWGWQAHCLNWKGRHFIKRLYGEYPEIPVRWRTRLTLGE